MHDDEEEAKRIVAFIGADKYGENDAYILNKDLETYSITNKDINNLFRNLTRQLVKEPDEEQVFFFFFASHGIDKNSMQHIVLNQFDKT